MNPKTNEELRTKFNTLNKKYFSNRLYISSIKFSARKSTRRLGVCRYNLSSKLCAIEINPLLKGKDITETLVHEMCHVANYIDYGYSNHKAEFKAEAMRVYVLSEGKVKINTHSTDENLCNVLRSYRKIQKAKRLVSNRQRFERAIAEIVK